MAIADLTRQRLVRAALELFTTQGYHGTTTGQVAKKAGVAEGTMYRHFDGKQHLLNELYRAAARWAARTAQEADGAALPVRGRLGQLAQRLIAGAVREPAVVQLFLLDRFGPLLDEKSREAAREFRAVLERMIAQGKAEGVVRAGAADVWAGAWLAVVGRAVERVLAREWGENSPGVRLSVEAAWDAIAAR